VRCGADGLAGSITTPPEVAVAEYLPILTLFVLAGLFSVLSFLASRLLAPSRPTAAKSAPYECGIVPDREPIERFPVRFYIVAMIFIIFDIEIIFLYPWAVVFRRLGPFGLAEILVFAAAVFVSFVYLIAEGALDWGPVKKLRRLEVDLGHRTTTSTVRRIRRGGEAA
jgi:NADH-quinone oxidoreductase subunit A